MSPRQLALDHGTPLYHYELDEVDAAHADLRAALPAGAVLHYSLKANPHPDVAGRLATLGCRAEVSSTGELAAALAAGFTPENCAYTGPGKTAAELAAVLAAGVRRFSVESVRDLAEVDTQARRLGVRTRCLLRINPDQPLFGMGLAMGGVSSKFGVDFGQVLLSPNDFRDRDNAAIVGLHLYLGTNIVEERALLAQYEVALTICGRIATTLGREFDEVNLGGGFGAPYARVGKRPAFPGLADAVAERVDTALPWWRPDRHTLSFESGRYLVGCAGSLIASVVDVKLSKGERHVVLDTGINHLGGMAGLRRLPAIQPEVLVASRAGVAADASPARLVGPLCTPLDSWGPSTVPADLRPGDLVVVPNVGAYGLTASLVGFLGHPAPVEVVTRGDRVVSASRLDLVRTPTEGTRTAPAPVPAPAGEEPRP